MEYRKLGRSGLDVSVLGLGTNSFGSRADELTSARILATAIDAGINFIDTANVYTKTLSESIIGRALRASGRRQEVVLATKVGMPRGDGANSGGSSRQEIVSQLDASLARLQTDYVDLYQIHTYDASTPLDETLRALDDLVRAGKIRYIGASNYSAWELMKAQGIAWRDHLTRYVSVQPCYSLADRTIELELEPMCRCEGIGIIPYFPLAGGILSGKYRDGAVPGGSRAEREPNFQRRFDEARLELATQVDQVALSLGTTAATLSLAWLRTRQAVSTIIVGASRPQQVTDNLASVDLALDADTLARLDDVSAGFRHAPPFGVFRPLA